MLINLSVLHPEIVVPRHGEAIGGGGGGGRGGGDIEMLGVRPSQSLLAW